MQAKLVPQSRDGLVVGRSQLNPDEAIRLADMIADVGKGNGLDFRIVE